MPNENKRAPGTFAAAVLLAASALVSAPASAAKPPPPPIDDYDKWYFCTIYGPLAPGVDCCDFPGLLVPCDQPGPLEPVILPLEGNKESVGN